MSRQFVNVSVLILLASVALTVALPRTCHADSKDKSGSSDSTKSSSEKKTKSPTKPKSEVERGESIFKQNCASCHPAGGNTVTPARPIVGSKKITNYPVFKEYLRSPVGHMPYYKHLVHDEKAMKALYKYCRTISVKPPEHAKSDDLPAELLSTSMNQ